MIFVIFTVLFIFIVLPLMVFFAICHWEIFTKAGVEGWKCLIPFYNIYIQLQITKDPELWMLYFFIPFIGIYFGIKHIHHVSLAFGKDTGFTIGMIFLPIIFFSILAFGNASYVLNEKDNLIDEIQEFK